MIIKGSRRAGSLRDAQALLDHLMRGLGNERVYEVTGPGAVADLVNDARAFAVGGRDHAVWHLSISPEVEMTPAQWARVRALLLEAYKTRPDLPTASVQHLKPHRQAVRGKLPARAGHEHMVFGTTDPLTGRQVDPYMHYVVHERVARQLEWEFGHPLVRGKHNGAVHRWFTANGKTEIAQAMEAAGFLEEPAISKVSDRERSVAIREGRDPFAAVDASKAALAATDRTPLADRGQALRQHYADDGFVLARGDGRLVLVPVDGKGKPVGAARKAGIREAALREILGAEHDRLPHLPKGADVAAWLQGLAAAALAPQIPHTPGEVPDHAQGTKDHHPFQHRSAQGHQSRSGSRRAPGDHAGWLDRDGIRRDPGRDHDRPGSHRDPRPEEASGTGGEPAGSSAPAAPDPGHRSAGAADGSASEQPRLEQDARTSRRRTTRFEQARLTRVVEQHLRPHRGTLAQMIDQVRQPPDPARVATVAEHIIAARRHAAEAIRISEPAPPTPARQDFAGGKARPVRGIELSDAERGGTMVGEHKRVWILVALRRRYDTGWLPPAVVQHIVGYEYDRGAQEVRLTLDNGAIIRDGMTRIVLEGRVDEVSVDELVAAVQRRGWRAVNLVGSLDFQRAAALRLGLLDPPIGIAGSQLSPEDIERIAEFRATRMAERVTGLVGIRP